MLIDAFLYNGEIELVYLREAVLQGKVDKFLLVEGSRTFTGIVKDMVEPPQFIRNLQSVTVEDFPEATTRNAWKREMWQRNAILRGLNGYPDDTLVMVSDVDEIPDPKDIPDSLESGELIRFQHEFYHFNFNNHVVRDNSAQKGWSCTALCRLDDLRKWYPQGVRNQLPGQIIHSGWHFSWFHKPEEKIEAYSHVELKDIAGTIPEKVQKRWDYQYEEVKGLKHLPQVVQDNPERWSHYFAKD